MRFDDPGHLQTWHRTGAYPRIHDAIAGLVIAEMRGRRVLDLGCNYGLLGDRIITQAGAELVIGVDADAKVLQAGREAGIRAHLVDLKINEKTTGQLAELVSANQITVILARRVLPELFGHDVGLGHSFAMEMARAGITEVFIEGRIPSLRATNELSSIEAEISLMQAAFRVAFRTGALAYLAARSASIC